jgi:hypothetical protein
VNRFIDHLYTWLGYTSNSSTTANIHNSQITTALAKHFPTCYIFTSRSLATASNSGDSSASHPQILSSLPPMQNSTQVIAPTVQAIISRNVPHRNPVLLLLRSFPLLRQRVYQGFAQKWSLLIRLSRSCCIATTVHAIIHFRCHCRNVFLRKRPDSVLAFSSEKR